MGQLNDGMRGRRDFTTEDTESTESGKTKCKISSGKIYMKNIAIYGYFIFNDLILVLLFVSSVLKSPLFIQLQFMSDCRSILDRRNRIASVTSLSGRPWMISGPR